MGWVAVIPVLIGGAVGGALPDIDTEGAAIEKMGSKSTSAAYKTVGKMGGTGKRIALFISAVGQALDSIFLAPLGKLWRFLSQNVFGRVYLAVYRFGSFGEDSKTLGEVLHWNGESKPWAHRGGITHSFSFMLTSCVLTVPVAFIFQSPEFLIGAELGIISHLFADSLCKSGVKFFFPFQPKIGFDNDSGAGRGRDIRLLPKGMQVSTGKDRITNSELDNYTDPVKAAKDRKLRFREKLWQWIFKLLAVVAVVLLVVGWTGRAGGVAFSANLFGEQDNPIALSSPIDSLSQTDGNTQPPQNDKPSNTPVVSPAPETVADNETPMNNAVSQTGTASIEGTGDAYSQVDIGVAGKETAGVNPVPLERSATSKPEMRGPSSLTMADVSVKDLPRGIMKMPDESLWVVGVGPVNRENLDNPKWTFTQEEKDWLLLLASKQRMNNIPKSINDVPDIINDVANTAQETIDNAQEAGGDAANGLAGWLSDISGIDIAGSDGTNVSGGGYTGGFLGLTEWTNS